MVSTVKPNAKATPKKPIWRPGKPAAAKTAAPHPPSTSHSVPKNSAMTRRVISLSIRPLPALTYQNVAVENAALNPSQRGGWTGCLKQAALSGRHRRAPRSSWGDARYDPHPAVVEFEVKRRARIYRGGLGDNLGSSIANHDIAAREHALMALRMCREPPRKIVDRIVPSANKPAHRGTQARLGLAESRSDAGKIGRESLRPQP